MSSAFSPARVAGKSRIGVPTFVKKWRFSHRVMVSGDRQEWYLGDHAQCTIAGQLNPELAGIDRYETPFGDGCLRWHCLWLFDASHSVTGR